MHPIVHAHRVDSSNGIAQLSAARAGPDDPKYVQRRRTNHEQYRADRPSQADDRQESDGGAHDRPITRAGKYSPLGRVGSGRVDRQTNVKDAGSARVHLVATPGVRSFEQAPPHKGKPGDHRFTMGPKPSQRADPHGILTHAGRTLTGFTDRVVS